MRNVLQTLYIFMTRLLGVYGMVLVGWYFVNVAAQITKADPWSTRLAGMSSPPLRDSGAGCIPAL